MKETIVRFGAWILNLAAVIWILILQILAHSAKDEGFVSYLGYILVFVIFIFELKAEYDFLDDHRPLIIAITWAITGAIQIGVNLGMESTVPIMEEISGFVALVLSITAWHFILSIYAREKKIHIASIIVAIVLWMVFNSSAPGAIGIPILLIIGMLVALAMEMRMVKKGLMKYIKN